MKLPTKEEVKNHLNTNKFQYIGTAFWIGFLSVTVYCPVGWVVGVTWVAFGAFYGLVVALADFGWPSFKEVTQKRAECLVGT